MTKSEARKIRESLGLTQIAFAKLLGVHNVTVNRWESGYIKIPEATARHLRLAADRYGRQRAVQPKRKQTR
jgi:DNA-binding transcriptional regulator YiaG